MMKIFVCKNKKIIKNVSPKQLKKYLKDKKASIWVDFEKPTEAEYKFIQDTFKFHVLSMEDSRKEIELPKLEIFEDYIFIVLHSVTYDIKKNTFNEIETDFFLGKNFLVTIHQHKCDSIARQIQKFEENTKKASRTADFIMYEIIDSFVDKYFPLIDHWENNIEVLEDSVVSDKPPKNSLKQIMRFKKEVVHIKKSISPERDVINKLTRRDIPYIKPRTSVYFRDVSDHILRIYSELESQRDLLNSTFEAYASMLSSQMTASSNRMNEVMKKLTIIATIFMPLTFITGVYGMNFRYMPELFWPIGYYVIIGIMIIVAVLMFWYFRKKKWM